MAFPVVEATNFSTESVPTTSHGVDMPSGVVSGNRLIVGIVIGDWDMNTPTGWTRLVREFHQNHTLFVYHRESDGTEGASVTFTSTDTTKSVHLAYRISGAGTPELGGRAESVSADTSPDPGSFTPSFGAQDILWLPICGCEGENVTSAPANYTNLIAVGGGTSSDPNIGSARRALNAASEDPGAFTLSGAAHWTANVVAVPPAGGAGPSAPTGVTASNPTSTTIDLDWTDTNGATAFPNMYRRLTSVGGAWTFVEQLAASAVSYTFTGLDPGTEYDLGVSYSDS